MRNATRGLLDVHAHAVPTVYREAVEASEHRHPDGLPFPLPEWSPASHLAMMRDLGIARAWLSVSSPGVLLTGSVADAAELSRAVNAELSAVSAGEPERFSFLASLPLPDVDAAVLEAEHALRRPGAVGVVLMTNAGGTYPGSPDWEPLWRLLEGRRARVLLHPTSPPDWQSVSPLRTRSMIEFHFDTTRAVVDLVLAGVPTRHPGISFIVPHAGACLPLVADRVQRMQAMLTPSGQGADVDVLAALAGLWYDTAGGPVPRALPAVRSIAGPGRLVYGSDYPFTSAAAVTGFTADLLEAMSPAEREGLEVGAGPLG